MKKLNRKGRRMYKIIMDWIEFKKIDTSSVKAPEGFEGW